MQFDLLRWLFQDPATAGADAGLSGSEPFHFLWPWVIFCGLGLLVWFYYTVEGRKRFVKGKPIAKRMLDRFLGWLAVLCLVGFVFIFARVAMDSSLFAWRFWRYLWGLGLLTWAVVWVVYLIKRYPKERANMEAWNRRQQYIPAGKRKKAKAGSR
ncbi:hypothetical protein EI42_00883 [Thermosporothrix hazakensis]|jgi:hypothetical protein|uniref:Uncharacterized protein n=2 Tax=Thermosporothrix TaxID=768650 RepID=A0A326UDM2_THEHA|nr:hypothetical protein [Thermosporothrix hazakensis]PZW36702.1 hypothetical protein EI42_00883 [Thermosporothrix hazakensis]BBH89170.1 hypothetical protein KTC_39210 [Thermosporothrix sp. COM3]GCE47353.1 hypothetical protein KTH_22220 [Thermosporothrix hazakensis]